jgi:hypothetical protein
MPVAATFLISTLLACLATSLMFPALSLRKGPRIVAWLACSIAVGLTPCLLPAATPARTVSSLVAIGLLAKLYDVYQSGDLMRGRSFLWYLAWLPNDFWLALRREPPERPRAEDVRKLPRAAIQGAAAAGVVVVVFWYDWSTWPFFLEHCIKTVTAYAGVAAGTNLWATLWRLSGGRALDFMESPILAATPADFWRRWNLPVHAYFSEHIFRPLLRGHRDNRLKATLMAFFISGLVHEYVFGIAAGRWQGWQMLYFMIHGLATIATAHIRPGRYRLLAWLLTALFQLTSSVLFGQSVGQVLPFYSPRP